MNDSQTILFYGALGNGKRYIVGGGETGNYRTIELLQKSGKKVILLRKPYPDKNLIGYLIYSARMFFVLLAFAVKLLRTEVHAVHISGFYLHLIYHEYLLVRISRLMNVKCIYELRGGGVTEAYHKRSSIYRYFFKKTLRHASLILCQGEGYINFLRTLTDVNVFHYPNYILNGFSLNGSHRDRSKDAVLQLVYFGRLVQSKNLDFLLSVTKELMHQSVAFQMEIIGSGDEEYISQIKQKAAEQNLTGNIIFSGPVSHKKLNEKLANKHFFLFPSNEKREGHSNALTEAMALGIVPVCSNAGFNAEIVGDAELVITDYEPGHYVDVIRTIWENGKWEKYSKRSAQRVKDHYTEQIARRILVEAYENN